jgi:hypothetical protein
MDREQQTPRTIAKEQPPVVSDQGYVHKMTPAVGIRLPCNSDAFGQRRSFSSSRAMRPSQEIKTGEVFFVKQVPAGTLRSASM